MKIVLSYIHFPLAMGKYFEAALRRREDVELITVGPFTGSYIPWNGGMHIHNTAYCTPPSIPLPMNGHLPVAPIGWVEQQLPWQADLWLQIDAGWYLRGRPNHGKNVIVATDPHVLDYDHQRQLADTFYCMQSPYMKPGDEYLPYGYDPTVHYPEEQPQNYDVCLIGLLYQEREKLVNELRRRGLRVYCDIGPIFDEYRQLYCQAPIAIAWSSKADLCARVFEGMAMKRLVVSNDVPDIERFFYKHRGPSDLVVFNSLREATELIMFYSEHPEAAQKIAQKGYESVKPHTWDNRVNRILEAI